MTDKAFAASFFAALISMVNPISTLPFFIAFTRDVRSWKLKCVLTIMLSTFVFGALIIFMFFGNDILYFFGISFPAFKVAGAVIISGIGLSMVQGSQDDKVSDTLGVANGHGFFSQAFAFFPKLVAPLGVPLLVGGGSISVVVVYGIKAQAHDALIAEAVGVVLSVCIVLAVCYNLSSFIMRIMGRHGLDIAVRLFGLVLLGIGIQLMVEGISGLTLNLINPKIL